MHAWLIKFTVASAVYLVWRAELIIGEPAAGSPASACQAWPDDGAAAPGRIRGPRRLRRRHCRRRRRGAGPGA